MRERIHFVGAAGTGMSALAQLRAKEGHEVSGSDRQADKAGLGETGERLKAAGISLHPQDGSGVTKGTSRVVISTAIEGDNLDIKRAQKLGVPVVHRADELAAVASARRTIAVAGTSGKSTVTAMVFHILEKAGRSPSLVSGANLPSVRSRGLLGNAWLGESDLLVIEADESDGTIDRYSPHVGLLLNVTKDHKGLSELFALFAGFKAKSARFVASADAPELEELRRGAFTYGFESGHLRGSGLQLTADSSRFFVEGREVLVPLPGRYNAENALAAMATALHLDVSPADSGDALRDFSGVSRRFELIGEVKGISVYDDYAHNPEKVKAVLGAAHLKAPRVLAVFQLHGFAPARFMKAEFLDAFTASLKPGDILFLPDIFYAGGTAAKDISAADYAAALRDRGVDARHMPARRPDEIAQEANSGDLILVLGARDPSLPAFAGSILNALLK